MPRVLITGSNSGFGLLTALTLARGGHEVIATMRNLDKGAGLVEAIAAEDLPIEIRRLDVCDADSVAEAIGDPTDVDGVVNNAGFEVNGALQQVGDELLTAQFDTNVLGPMRVARAVLPAWRTRGSGAIVNVSSVAGIVGVPFGGAYAASKHALEALSEALHFEVAYAGIRVRLVEPGRFDTGFGDRAWTPDGWEETPDFERAQRFRDSQAALGGGGPAADPQEVADAIVRALLEPETPFRQFVGDDAQLIHHVKTTSTFEDFEAAMRTTLDWHD